MMVNQENQGAASGNGLLTSQEQAICEQMTTREAPHSQRALALLALDGGATQAQAAEQAGLSPGQVKYWIARFRKQRLGIFPEAFLSELSVAAEGTALENVSEADEGIVPADEEIVPVERKTKGSKGGKGKKSRKVKGKTRKALKDKSGKTPKGTGKKPKKGVKPKKTKVKSKSGKKVAATKKGKVKGKGKKGKKGKKRRVKKQ
jgi:transposase-like protein